MNAKRAKIVYGELTLHTHKTKCTEENQETNTNETKTAVKTNIKKPRNILTVLMTEGVENQRKQKTNKRGKVQI